MKTLVKYTLPDGGEVVAEVEATDAEEQALERVSRRSDAVVVDSANRLEDISRVVRPMADTLHEQFSRMDIAPTEVELEFGVKLTLAAGAVIASTGAEGSVRVLLRWRTDK